MSRLERKLIIETSQNEDGFFIMSSYDMQHNTFLGIQNDEIVSGFFSI